MKKSLVFIAWAALLFSMGCSSHREKQAAKDSNMELLPAEVSEHDTLVQNLTDLYKGGKLLHQLRRYVEERYRYDDTTLVDTLKNMSIPDFADRNTTQWTNNYITITKEVLRGEPDSLGMAKFIEAYGDYWIRLGNRYGKPEAEIERLEQKMGEVCEILRQETGRDSLVALYHQQPEEAMRVVLNKYNTATNFDHRCSYGVFYAHTLFRQERLEEAQAILEELMSAHLYSPHLEEVWRTWRCMVQLQYGESKDSEIPNGLYNARRKECLTTILQHIVEHPDDDLAVFCFAHMVFVKDIFREATEYGNQILLELLRWGLG